MKKILLSLSIVMLIGAFTSCKKTRICECKMTIEETNREIVNKEALEDKTQSEAEDICKKYEDSYGGIATCKVL